MRYEIRTLGPWIGPITNPRQRAQFRANWSATLEQLGRETDKLGARLVVLQVDVTDQWIRRDGMLHARAQVGSPAVRVAFESRHGPLTYAADRYDRWQDNLRAIVLSLEALRAVDRYGVSSRGEQYKGWTAIAATAQPVAMAVIDAARLLAEETDFAFKPADLIVEPALVRRAFRGAMFRNHPDHGGDGAKLDRITAARDLLLNGAAQSEAAHA